MLRHGTDARRDDRGAAAVEFALILPLLVMLIVGMIQFGFVFNAYITVTHAAREGARMAAVNAFSVAAVKGEMVPLDTSKVSVTSTLMTDATYGSYYKVVVSYPYQLSIPFWKTQSLTLSSTAQMRKE
jgi:Flp pilus assembly protein TadG